MDFPYAEDGSLADAFRSRRALRASPGGGPQSGSAQRRHGGVRLNTGRRPADPPERQRARRGRVLPAPGRGRPARRRAHRCRRAAMEGRGEQRDRRGSARPDRVSGPHVGRPAPPSHHGRSRPGRAVLQEDTNGGCSFDPMRTTAPARRLDHVVVDGCGASPTAVHGFTLGFSRTDRAGGPVPQARGRPERCPATRRRRVPPR